jgi:hypothetical protein
METWQAVEPEPEQPAKNAAAFELDRRGGLKDGKGPMEGRFKEETFRNRPQSRYRSMVEERKAIDQLRRRFAIFHKIVA